MILRSVSSSITCRGLLAMLMCACCFWTPRAWIHLLRMKGICHCPDNWPIHIRSLWMNLHPAVVRTSPPAVLSSAHLDTENLSPISRLLVYTTKRIGPSTDPCVAPLMHESQSVSWPLSEPRYFLKLSQIHFQAVKFPRIPAAFILLRCLTLEEKQEEQNDEDYKGRRTKTRRGRRRKERRKRKTRTTRKQNYKTKEA